MKPFKEQLARIKANDIGYPAQVKINKGRTATQLTSLNDESATALVEWLKANYNVTEYTNVFGGDWHLDDIIDRAYSEVHEIELSSENAKTIANNIERTHDANIGVNWEVIDEHIRMFIQDQSK